MGFRGRSFTSATNSFSFFTKICGITLVSYSLFKKPLLLTSTKTRKDRVSLTDLINNLQPNDVLFKGIWDPEKMDEIEKHEEKAHQKFYNGNLTFLFLTYSVIKKDSEFSSSGSLD